MGFKGIAATLALLTVVLTAGTAQADNRNTVYGYMRSNFGVSLSPAMGDFRDFKIAEDAARLGNEGPWGEIGWNMNLYTGEDKVTGNVHYMITTWDMYGSAASLGHKEFYFDIKNLPGLDAEIWTGQRDWLVNAVDMTDREYWNSSGVGAGITNLKIGSTMTFHYGLLRPDANGLKHVVQLRGIELFTGSSIDVGAAAAHTMVEDAEAAGLTNGFSGHLRWTQNNILGGRNVLYVGAGMGAMADAKNFVGANYAVSEDALKAMVINDLQIRPMPELGISFVVLAQHDEHNSNAPVGSGGIRNRIEFGARLNYDVSKYVALMLDGSYDMMKFHGVDAMTLMKITPAVQLNVSQGNVPRIRLFTTIASWNDSAGLMTNSDGDPLLIPGETSGITAGIAGEAWF